MLGFRWVAKFADEMTHAAANALAKISAVVPDDLKDDLENTALLVGPRTISDTEAVDLEVVRAAIRRERKVRIAYVDGAGNTSERVIWPFALGYFQKVRIVAGWCEQRDGFRHFRTDRMLTLTKLDEHYPRRRAAMLREWRATQIDAVYRPGC